MGRELCLYLHGDEYLEAGSHRYIAELKAFAFHLIQGQD